MGPLPLAAWQDTTAILLAFELAPRRTDVSRETSLEQTALRAIDGAVGTSSFDRPGSSGARLLAMPIRPFHVKHCASASSMSVVWFSVAPPSARSLPATGDREAFDCALPMFHVKHP